MAQLTVTPKPWAGDRAPVSFLSLPSELRNVIYELSLLRESPIAPKPGMYEKPSGITISLLRAHRAVHGEASALFYGRNRLDLRCMPPRDVAAFLFRIGPANAACIRDVLIDFPRYRFEGRRDIILSDGGASVLDHLRAACPDLRLLTTSRHSTGNGIALAQGRARLGLYDDTDGDALTGMLHAVDAAFKSMPAVQKVTIEVEEFNLCTSSRAEMSELGWEVDTTMHGYS